MRWDVALKAWLDALEADAALVAELGAGWLFEAQAGRKVRVPSVDYLVTGNPEGENTEELLIQVDIFALGWAQAALVERRIRALAHKDMPLLIEGLAMWTRHLGDGRTLPYPKEEGVVHRSLSFELEFARQEA